MREFKEGDEVIFICPGNGMSGTTAVVSNWKGWDREVLKGTTPVVYEGMDRVSIPVTKYLRHLTKLERALK